MQPYTKKYLSGMIVFIFSFFWLDVSVIDFNALVFKTLAALIFAMFIYFPMLWLTTPIFICVDKYYPQERG
ncbi:putative membrane protein [Campylobacter vicugnae]|uniref:Membrane protein n=1 Tax=Campylobacter vicugnae TaxID=1660076 RepID=A0A1X9T017_9BACT|nr:hypothetical protein [Campylobacter sp. RM8964]ARR01858.1 putative membrane protein [Campylobacter sp. RM8964]